MDALCDTNVLSELVKRRPDPGVESWAETVSRLAISAVTFEEVHFGLAWKPNPRIRFWVDSLIGRQIEVLPVTIEIARKSGQLRGAFQGRGETRSMADMLIASTAALHGLTLVTRNERDFKGCGISILNPFAY